MEPERKKILPEWANNPDIEDLKELDEGIFVILTKNTSGELSLLLKDHDGTFVLDFGGHLNSYIDNETIRKSFEKIKSSGKKDEFHSLSLTVRQGIELRLSSKSGQDN